jgi:hypothetical protein
LTILSQMHFSEFNLGAWLCLNLGYKVVGRPRRWGADPLRNQREISAKSAPNQPQIPRKINKQINRRSPGKIKCRSPNHHN